MESYRRRDLGSLETWIWRVYPCVVPIWRVVLRIGILRPFHLLIASVSSIVEVGEFKLGLVQQGLPYRNILETRVIPGGPEVVLRIPQRVVGNQVMLYVMNGDGHRLL